VQTIATRSTGPDSSWSVMEDKEERERETLIPGRLGLHVRDPAKNRQTNNAASVSILMRR
jgi:hypothetical protein